MSVLRNLESKIADAVEGTFSRVFRSEVRPVEIARRLAREMDDHQSESLAAVYVPNEYKVYLSPKDHARFAEYEEALAGELASYLLEYARRERFALLSQPVIEFETDERLGLGQFGIQTSVVHPHEDLGPVDVQSGQTVVQSAAARFAEPIDEPAIARTQRAVLHFGGRRLVVGPQGVVIGRSRECDIVVEDPNVSRRHADVRPHAGAWVLTDLGSTNGSRLNGRTIAGPEVIQPGDEIEIGASVIGFELE